MLLVVVHGPAVPFVIVLVCVMEPEWLAGQLKNCVSMLTTGAGAVYPEQNDCCHVVE